ncbi:MAG: ABC-F family ATP-binding cassette domain-containing protein [Gammaproteobacteria bacterium]|nr:ABC-F family ATP-binding cassette domain-containing protein [Gammaproteobacteria bacterium]
MQQDAVIIKQLSYQHSGQVILKDANLSWTLPLKTALIGANGAGKTTLLKLMCGLLTPDHGEIIWPNYCLVSYLPQQPDLEPNDTILMAVLRGLGADGSTIVDWLLEPNNDALQAATDKIDTQRHLQQAKATCRTCLLDTDTPVSQLSEGLKRRVAFAQSIIREPDVLILDEPTNHLDIAAIDWLTQWCQNFKGSIILVSHDRQLIDDVAEHVVEIDHGQIMGWPGNYSDHIKRRDQFLAEESQNTQKLDKKIAQEMHWLARGVTARRKRNQGRLRALHALKEQRAARINRDRQIKISDQGQGPASQKLIQLKDVSFGYNTPLVSHLTFTLNRGDHIGIIGRNGCGKSTLIKLMLGELKPTQGEVIHGPTLNVAYFDQKKDQLDLNKSLLDNISGGQTHVELNGQKKHAISYLQDFLFSSERIQTPVKHFSGGEKQRALLAKLFLKPANVYILDEPTNDLDLDTLDALEQFLVETKSAILLVSHDRAFINQIATQVLYFDDANQITEYAGGYDDALTQGAKPIALMQETNAKKPTKAPKNKDHRAIRRVLDKIKRLEKQIEDQSNLLTQPDVYNDFEKVKTIQLTLKTLEADKDVAYDTWLELEDD